MLESILLGVLSNVIYGIGTGIIKFSQKDKSIQVHIREAHKRALNRWSANSFLIDREELKFNDKFELLKHLLFDFKNDEISIENPDLSLFLDLFKEEILRDNFAWNSFESEYLRFIYRDIQEIKEKLENINIKKEELLKSYVPDFFIKNSDKLECYINRRLSHYTQKAEKENVYFRNEISENVSLIDLINNKKNKRIILLGSAGMGKSTELEQTAHRIVELNNGYYPIFCSLNTYTADNDFDNFLPKEWENIPQSQLIILLDGFDEILPEDLSKAKRKIIQFSEDYPNLIIIISCRSNHYDLPINSNGTLKGFDPYFIEELSISDVKNHIDTYEDFDSSKFILEVEEKRMLDLITNPFFLLQLIIKTYKSLNFVLSNNRADIFRDYFESRYAWDKDHYNETIKLNYKKYDAIDSLMKVALTMEIIGKRVIHSDEIYQILASADNIELISYCTAFEKVEGLNDTWQFEHKYFQEYLAAAFLSKQTNENILNLICIKDFNKVSPQWQNTLTLLISLIPDPIELINWLIKNDKEVLVRIEREKISPELRIQIYKQIFNYYKVRNIWLASNKFSESELAYFGQSDECIQYTINEILNTNNHRRFRISVLKILGKFKLNKNQIQKITNNLIELLKTVQSDFYFESEIIEVFNEAEINDKDTIDKLFICIGKRRNQDIRSSMYRLLNNSLFINDYLDYFLEGLEILKSVDSSDRESYHLEGEETNLIEGLKKINSSISIKKLINFIINESNFKYGNYDEDLFPELIKNAILIYNEDESIYFNVIDLLSEYSRMSYEKEAFIIKSFFEKTETLNRAFSEILAQSFDDSLIPEVRHILAFLATENNIIQIIDAFNQNKIKNKTLEIIYWEINYINKELANKFKGQILEHLNIKIENPVDYNKFFNNRIQLGFNILFDFELFKEETLKIFEDRVQLTPDNLRHDKYYNHDTSHLYNLSSFSLIENLIYKKEYITKRDVLDWFENKTRYERYKINEIYNKLRNRKDIEISPNQSNIIKEWFDSAIENIDFTKAITYNENGSFSVNNNAYIISFFLNKFNFDCSKTKLLDMFLFVFDDDRNNNFIKFEQLIAKLDKNEVDKRIVENIIIYKDKLESRILMNHIDYIFSNNLREGYDSIFNIIIDSELSNYKKENIINSFIKSNEDYHKIKELYEKVDIDIKLFILKLLIDKQENDYVIDKLLILKAENKNKEVNELINNYLIQLEDLRGLIFSIEWIKKYKFSPFSQNRQTLNYFKEINTLPYFMELLELSYDKSIKVDHKFNQLWSIVISGIEHLALYSSENYHQVIIELNKFIENNKTRLEDVEFLNNPIERIKGMFMNNIVQKHDIRSAKRIIDSFI